MIMMQLQFLAFLLSNLRKVTHGRSLFIPRSSSQTMSSPLELSRLIPLENVVKFAISSTFRTRFSFFDSVSAVSSSRDLTTSFVVLRSALFCVSWIRWRNKKSERRVDDFMREVALQESTTKHRRQKEKTMMSTKEMERKWRQKSKRKIEGYKKVRVETKKKRMNGNKKWERFSSFWEEMPGILI